jgi:hypothetical protein
LSQGLVTAVTPATLHPRKDRRETAACDPELRSPDSPAPLVTSCFLFAVADEDSGSPESREDGLRFSNVFASQLAFSGQK